MSKENGIEFTEQKILNEAQNDTYKTLDVTPMIETGAGTVVPLGYQAPLPAKIINSDSTDNSLSTGGQIGQKVQIVGDGDKYVRGVVQEGASLDQVQPVHVGWEDPSGNSIGAKSDTAGNLYSSVAGNKTVLLDSSTNLLTAGASYTGSWIQVMGKYGVLNLASFINVSGFGGASRYASVQVQFSSDGVTWNGTFVALAVGYSDANPSNVAINVLDNYARLVVTEVGGYDWSAAGGSPRTTLVGVPSGAGSFVRPLGSSTVVGDFDPVAPPVMVGGRETANPANAPLPWGMTATAGGEGIGQVEGVRTTYSGTALVTSQKLATSSTAATVAVAATSTQVLASQTSRIGITIYNDSSQIVYLKKGTGCSTTSFDWILQPYDILSIPSGIGYSGVIHHIAAVATGNLRVSSW